MASDLAELLRQDGFNSVQEAVGVNQKWTQDLSKNIILPQETNEIKFERSARNIMLVFFGCIDILYESEMNNLAKPLPTINQSSE